MLQKDFPKWRSVNEYFRIWSEKKENTDTAEKNGYDAGKKISGIKRHIAVDTQGLPYAIHKAQLRICSKFILD